jgi:hypothetical protein
MEHLKESMPTELSKSCRRSPSSIPKHKIAASRAPPQAAKNAAAHPREPDMHMTMILCAWPLR